MQVVRYMGTKGYLVPDIHRSIDELPNPPTRLIDLFAGTGSVASSFVDQIPVTCGDALEFVALLARSRFLSSPTLAGRADVKELVDAARAIAQPRLKSLSTIINEEHEALRAGSQETQRLINNAKHAANSSGKKAAAASARNAGTYRLTELYFARGYFSTAQAVEIDAVRSAIDQIHPQLVQPASAWRHSSIRDAFLAAWLVAASRVANSPGHAAQFLKSRTERGHARVAQNWRRDFFQAFFAAASDLSALGTPGWRAGNEVLHGDAIALGSKIVNSWPKGALIYADPPYTKDHYSRYYHVYETLLRYDYPPVSGVGRVRDERHLSAFCYRTRVRDAFDSLCATASSAGASLLVSYPKSGLLPEDELFETLRQYGPVSVRASIPRRHSTLGGSSGSAFKHADERLYLLTPS